MLAKFSLSLRLKKVEREENRDFPPHALARNWQTVYLCFSLSVILLLFRILQRPDLTSSVINEKITTHWGGPSRERGRSGRKIGIDTPCNFCYRQNKWNLNLKKKKRHLRKFKYGTKRILGTKKNISENNSVEKLKRTPSLLKHESVDWENNCKKYIKAHRTKTKHDENLV